MKGFFLRFLLAFLSFVVLLCGCSIHDDQPDFFDYVPEEGTVWEGKDVGSSEQYAVGAPPFTDGIFPCMECHIEIEPNRERRALVDMHDDIDAIYDHDSENRWCFSCHDVDNRDFLRLANGDLLDFRESFKLCGQCHGAKLRDWKEGVHGKRKGMWNGKKEYLLCVHCHNPHSPKFKPLKPEPPPALQNNPQDTLQHHKHN